MDAAAILDAATRCLLAARGRRAPLVSPMAHWFDGTALWMTTVADAAKIAALRDDPACAVAVAPDADRPGVAARGRARVFGPGEPVRLALHAPAITGALSGLAARNLGALVGYATHAWEIPGRWAPYHRVVLRVTVDELELAEPPSDAGGVSPALPTEVPADVRRRLGGKRAVVALWDEPPLRLAPAVWGAGFALTFAAGGPRPRAGDRVGAVIDVDRGEPSEASGAVVYGDLDERGALSPDRVVWWRGFDVRSAQVAPASGGAVLPD